MRRTIALVATAVTVMASATPALAQESASITLIHGIPDTRVDVYVDGGEVFGDFAFGETQDLSALAGQTLVGLEVRLAGTDTTAIGPTDLELPASGSYTAIAHLDGSGAPTLSVFANDTSTIAAGSGRLTVRHTAAAPAVDVKADGSVAFSNLANPDEISADLPAATYGVEVVPSGADEPVVIGPADISVAEGDSLIVYAVGSLENSTLTVLTQAIGGLGQAPGGVPTGNSPSDDGIPLLPIAAVMLLVAAAAAGAVALARRNS